MSRVFSAMAIELAAERARESLALFDRLTAEFGDLQCTPVVKRGYATDGGEADDREHLWFEVHGLHGDHIDATLLNEPLAVSRLKIGTRGRHSVALLSDWAGMTPLGKLTPRSLELARSLRELRAEILASLHGAGA